MSDFPNWFVAGGAQEYFEKHLKRFQGLEVNFLQIGAFTGDASIWLLENILQNKNSKLVDVDTWQGSNEQSHAEFNWHEVEDAYDRKVNDFSSQVIKRKVTSDEFFSDNSQLFDFIYIDGSHKASDVLQDGLNAYKFLKLGGLVAFDDYLWSKHQGMAMDPKPAIDACRLCFSDRWLMVDQGLQVWFKSIS